jgi:hypothetical protein
MPLPLPPLDDRSYGDLRAELLRRIPVYAPEWTDHGPSDPGVTLLELFAFLGENLLFRFNQVPDATRMWVLRLLDVPLRPALAATGLVVVTPRTAAPVGVDAGSVVRAGDVAFTVEQDVTALPVAFRVAAKLAAPAPTDPELVQSARNVVDAADLDDDEAPVYYRTTELPADPLAPEARPLDLAAAVDRSLWVALLAPDAADGPALLAPGGPLDGAVVNLGATLDPVVGDLADVEPCRCPAGSCPGHAGGASYVADADDGRFHLPRCPLVTGRVDVEEVGGDALRRRGLEPCAVCAPEPGPEPPQLVWEVSTVLDDDDGAPVYCRLQQVGDTTGGLTRDGVVRLRLPKGLPAVGVPVPDDLDATGTGDLPPLLDDDPPVLLWLRGYPPAGAPEIGRLRWVGGNAAEITQTVVARPEHAGTGTGMPGQRMSLVHPQVVPGSVQLEVEESGRWVRWSPVEAFAGSGPDDRHFVLDPQAGTVLFGDTLRGRAPQVGERVRVARYRYGGGGAGNVAGGAVSALEGPAADVANPLPTTGGADAEDVATGLTRIPGELRRRDRAVTADDFRELAGMVAGVARAECLPRFHPHTQAVDAAGVVTVMVWPQDDPARPDAPQPSRGLLRQVCRHLDARRLVTTELYVVPPVYQPVAVSVGLAVKPGYSGDAVRRWVELLLRQYLAPVPPYGPEGAGWPLGRRVHGPELEAAALQVEGVEYLEGLEVAGQDDAGSWSSGTVELSSWEVPRLVTIAVVTGPPPPAGTLPPPPPTPPTLVPVPVLRTEC